MAVQVGHRSVSITWTPPSPAPPFGYLVFVPTADIYEDVDSTSYSTTMPVGRHTVRVETVSAYYFGETVTSVTVRGKGSLCGFSFVPNWDVSCSLETPFSRSGLISIPDQRFYHIRQCLSLCHVSVLQ